MIRFNNILFKSTLLVDLFPTSLISTNQNTQVSTAWARLEGIKAVRQRGELSTGQTWGDSCPLGVASLYKLLENRILLWSERGSQTLLRSETALTSCLQSNGNPEGINMKDALAWSAQKMSLILHHQVTGDPRGQEKNGWGSRQTCCTQQRGISGFQDCWTQLWGQTGFKCKQNILLWPPPRQWEWFKAYTTDTPFDISVERQDRGY